MVYCQDVKLPPLKHIAIPLMNYKHTLSFKVSSSTCPQPLSCVHFIIILHPEHRIITKSLCSAMHCLLNVFQMEEGGFVSNPFNSRGNFTQVAPTLLMDLNKNCSHLKMLLTDIGIDRFDLKKYHFQRMLENE